MKKLLFIAVISAFTSELYSQQTLVGANPFPKTITVTGSASMEIIPDEIYVLVDLKEYEKKGSGKVSLENIKSAFLQNCKAIGLPDSSVTIASYEGYNSYWLRKRRKAGELFASIAYQVKFSKSADIDRLVEKLDDDATQNFRILRTSHSKIEEYRKQLKIQAVAAAKEKGRYLTEAIDEKMGEAISINEPDENLSGYLNNYYKNENYMLAASNVNMMAGTLGIPDMPDVDFRKIKLRYEVNVVFALK